ncbi:MAG: hypothetical protein CMJ64_15260 [Planctomycetaceae bacterium]|nr:hypothetical protein [Planctomycetaceae bacterium]
MARSIRSRVEPRWHGSQHRGARTTARPYAVLSWHCSALLLGIAVLSLGARDASAAGDVDFSRDVRSIFVEKCYSCHGPDETKREGELRLDFESDVFAERDAATIVRGKPDESELYRRLVTDDGDQRMPPPDSGKVVSDQQKALLKKWIAEGAEWQEHWSFEKLAKPEVPKGASGEFVQNEIDHFTLARMQAESFTPNPAADRVTLIRRLSFDLIGLPPTPAEVDAFVNDSSPSAYEGLVDRLLASEHCGERMAIYWLDVARYADSNGFHGDNPRTMWLYRDYVIDAFNSNMPFDQFTIEQLAGDLIPEAGRRGLIASAYNRLLQTTQEGGAQAKEYYARYAADRVRNTAGTWLGTTMNCVECHNHKFDPLSMKDFYSMAAFFADIDEPAVGGPQHTKFFTPEQQAKLEQADARIAELNEKLKAQKSEEDQTAVKKELAETQTQRKKVHDSGTDLVITNVRATPREIRILPRGNWMDDSGAVVQPAIPAFFGRLETGDRRATRLDLARWIASPDNPLTPRVLVNRVWTLMFGTGISGDLRDAGTQGVLPTHPDLLNWLSADFVEHDWDVKRLVKQIVMSGTYRQSSLVDNEKRSRDPYNRLLARQNRWRLDAEFVRDTALSISGLLVRKVGGPSVRPYQPAGYWMHLKFPNRTWQHDTGQNLYRRGLYTWWQRTFLHPSLLAFDAPTREECTAQRARSNTPLQALVLLNDPTYVESARKFAERIVQEGGDSVEERARFAMRQATSRAARDVEVAVLSDLYEQQLKEYSGDKEAAEKLLATGLSPSESSTDVTQLAAWTDVARAVLNLNETITRN